jgi:GGDEF domain-containing protein
VEKLRAIADSHDLDQIRGTILAAATSMTESYECLRHETQLVVAQLQDELRSLHREIDSERRALYTDHASGAWTRDKLTARMSELLNHGDGFCMVVLWITNLKRVRATCSTLVVEGALKAMVKRLKGLVGTDATVGRWGEEEFAVLLEVVPATALGLSTEISRALSSRYSVQENGIAQYLTLRIATTMADHPAGSDPERFREKLKLLTSLLEGS